MIFERFSVKACCGQNGTAFKLGSTISLNLLASLIAAGYSESKSFTKAGILYVENEGLIITGAFNTANLQIKCKSGKNCANFLNDFEGLLSKLP